MRIKAVANGNVIEADDGAARQLIEAGIYEAADRDERKPTAPKSAPKKTAPKKASDTSVKPMTTADVPAPPKKPGK